ncbi:MAG: hypothetical protein HC892_00370 [Saprospiraceae bacterium]|nr:hypothetical protein [Saprospiraceae bacterium]
MNKIPYFFYNLSVDKHGTRLTLFNVGWDVCLDFTEYADALNYLDKQCQFFESRKPCKEVRVERREDDLSYVVTVDGEQAFEANSHTEAWIRVFLAYEPVNKVPVDLQSGIAKVAGTAYLAREILYYPGGREEMLLNATVTMTCSTEADREFTALTEWSNQERDDNERN